MLYFFGGGVFLVGAFDLSVEVVLEGGGRMAYQFFEGGADDFEAAYQSEWRAEYMGCILSSNLAVTCTR